MADQREQKQNYLRTEVMEQGEDVSQFIAFISSKRPNGENIDNWDLQELKDIVDEYKKYGKQGKYSYPTFNSESNYSDDESMVNNNYPQPKLSIDDRDDEKTNENLIFSEKDADESMAQNNADKKLKDAQAKFTKNYISPTVATDYCQQFEVEQFPVVTKLLIDKDMSVVLSDPKTVNPGIFHSSFITYKVTTLPSEWVVERRYSDFAWLREVLLQEYSLACIPPIAQKTMARQFEPAFVNKRMAFLQNFMNFIINHPELKSSPALYAFLKIKDASHFNTRKKDISNHKNKQSSFRENYFHKGKKQFEGADGLKITDFKSLSTDVTSVVNTKYKDMASAMGELILECQPIYTRIKANCKKLMHELDLACNTCWSISNEFKQAKSSIEKFNKKSVNIVAFPQLEVLYNETSIAFTQWGNTLSKRVKVIQDYMIRPMKFSKHEWTSLKNLCELRKNVAYDYLNGWKDLETRKKKLWEGGNVNKWDLDPQVLKEFPVDTLKNDKVQSKRQILHEDTRTLKNLQNVFGYINTKIVQEFENMFWHKVQRNTKSTIEFAHKYADLNTGDDVVTKNQINQCNDSLSHQGEPKPFYFEKDLEKMLAKENEDIGGFTIKD